MTWLNFYKFIDKTYYIPDTHLPEIHRRWNARWWHDDLLLWKYLRIAIPRWWDALEMVHGPRMITGNQNYLNYNDIDLWSESFWDTSRHIVSQGDSLMIIPKRKNNMWPVYCPKPIPPPGQWQLSLCYPKFFDFEMVLPYFAITTKSGWHIRFGCRWSDDSSGRYYILLSLALRKNPK